VTTPSNLPDGSPLGAAWVDNLALSNLVEALRLNPQESTVQNQGDTARFWSTPARPFDSPLQEVMQVTMLSPRMINTLSFDVSNFPVDITLEYYDADLRTWVPILDAGSVQNSAVQKSILDSKPSIIPSVSTVTGHVHPQHSFTGHWKSVEFRTKPFMGKDIRVVLKRAGRGAIPLNVFGQPVDYSLAIRHFYLGYQVESREDIPRTDPLLVSRDEYEAFASATDVLGSTVKYSLRTNRASNLLLANDDSPIWKSEPQPVPWAVVNLYVDTREPHTNNPQLIDRFLLDPLYDGIRFNLYWSNEEPSGIFMPVEEPIAYPLASTIDEASISGDVLHSGNANKDLVGLVDIDNTPLGFDPSRNWWIGGLLAFKFDHGTQNTASPLVDFGEFLIAMTPFGPRITTARGDTLLLETDPMAVGTPFHFIAGYDGTSLRLWVKQGFTEYSTSMAVTVPLKQSGMAPKMRFGGFQGSTPDVANFDLTALVVKVDEVATEETVADFYDDYSQFIQGDQKQNALLRYHESFSNSNYREGFIGGAPDRYASIEWNPIARDFLLRRGYLNVPATKARYWKFEFCGLVPEHYEVFRPVRRTVQTFMPHMWVPYPDSATLKASIRQLFPGIITSIIEGVTSLYQDGGTVATGSGGTGKGYTATTARIIRNDEVRGAVSQQYFVWNYLPLHSGRAIPCFPARGKHVYDTISVNHVTKVGYFVGLRSIQPVRLDYVTTDDNPEYVETFADKVNIADEGNWILDEDHNFRTGAARYAEARSVPFLSNRVIRAVQFATQQSDPRQVLPDDDFTDPTHSNWTSVGDAVLAPELTTHQVLGTMLQLDRAPQAGSWGQIELAYDTWGDLDNVPYGDLEGQDAQSADLGGVSSGPVDVPYGGQIHVAARVVAPVDLTEPLHVQIIDESTDRVLADSQIDVKANEVAEWYASYQINDLQAADVWRWGDFAAVQSGPSFNDDFARVNGPALGVMKSGQRWLNGANGSLVIASNRGVVTVEGQSNYFDALAPWGTLEVSLGTAGTGSSGQVKILEFEPIFMLTNGTLKYSGGTGLINTSVLTPNNTARSIQTDDVIKIEILPSRYVPAGKEDITYTVRDDVLRPYAIMVSLNGTWVRTITHDHGARPLRAIYGRLNQQFKSVKWTPANYGRLLSPVIMRYPRQGYGSFVDPENMKFIDGEGYTWVAEGVWDISTAVEVANDAEVGPPLTASANGSVMVTDTRSWYGSMTAYVRNVASTFGTGVKHGMVLCLDYDAGIYVNHAGNVVDKAGTNYGNLFPGGIANNSRITVQWAKTTLVNPFYRGGVNPTTFPDMLLAKVSGVTVGQFAHAALATWRGTKRGLAGDLYDIAGGSRPVAANYTLDTSFRSFNWAPDAYHTPNVTGPTWGNVTREGTATYASASLFKSPDLPQLSARVVQYGITNDLWFVDTLSMFVDPILWFFSNDGGFTFYPALNIRNNPNGVLLFPNSVPYTDSGQVPGKSLVWKVIAYAPECNVSHLVIRPWYGGILSPITHQVGIAGGGPNLMPYDHYADLRNDARFKTWSKPIPQSWWYAYRTIRPPLPDTLPPGPSQHLSPDLIIDTGSEA
jgi:hypothetical protein